MPNEKFNENKDMCIYLIHLRFIMMIIDVSHLVENTYMSP